MDHDKDVKIINGFVGRLCERTLACNSIKLRFAGKKEYIWIDPPWTLHGLSGCVADSSEYPGVTPEFEVWCACLNPLDRVRLTSVEYSKGCLVLGFSNDYQLIVPPSLGEVAEDDFYHHWYASE
ncbi:hypothetical protein [Isoalcanivorax pacificus]|uniref:hypothetical protein n=1 Tax=Isoalcanivorax pacificus TaxID=1306787 RepID=UPI001185140E|nr:hypothetical protein [Isoalcanivorax pacificus]